MVINSIKYGMRQRTVHPLALLTAPDELLAENKFAETPACD